jgi:hypothetical protein
MTSTQWVAVLPSLIAAVISFLGGVVAVRVSFNSTRRALEFQMRLFQLQLRERQFTELRQSLSLLLHLSSPAIELPEREIMLHKAACSTLMSLDMSLEYHRELEEHLSKLDTASDPYEWNKKLRIIGRKLLSAFDIRE